MKKMKKLLCTVLTLTLLLGTMGVVAASAEVLVGDINGSGEINLGDALYMRECLVGFIHEPPSEEVMDVDGNGEVNMKDYWTLRKIVRDINQSRLPVPENGVLGVLDVH